MLICIKDCYPKYDTTLGGLIGSSSSYYIRVNSTFSRYNKSYNEDAKEMSWTIRSELFPEIGGVVYDFENFMTLEDWRNLKIDQILC
jgi:hypothetical protein